MSLFIMIIFYIYPVISNDRIGEMERAILTEVVRDQFQELQTIASERISGTSG
jgi:predicted translin family RNA/ssDNA-binding protein